MRRGWKFLGNDRETALAGPGDRVENKNYFMGTRGESLEKNSTSLLDSAKSATGVGTPTQGKYKGSLRRNRGPRVLVKGVVNGSRFGRGYGMPVMFRKPAAAIDAQIDAMKSARERMMTSVANR